MTRPLPILAAMMLCGCTKQAAPIPAPAPPSPAIPTRAVVVTQAQEICRQVGDGNVIARLQAAVEKLTQRLRSDPAYGGAWFDHAPCYRIVYAFTDGRPRQWVIEAAEPELRPYIAFARTNYSLSQSEIARREITNALHKAGLWLVFIDPLDGRGFEVGVRTEADARIARSVIPTRYLLDVRIFTGASEPRPE